MKLLFALIGLMVGVCTYAITLVQNSVFAICGGVFVFSTLVMVIAMANAEEYPFDGRM